MRQILGAACGLLMGVACAAQAQDADPVVVELYTSQGCSSCPPADEFLALLTSDPRIIPLALHVDYWDYIGWADRFAQPRFTERQKAYARAIGSRTIYTPQMIVDGQDRVEGNNPEAVGMAIAARLAEPAPVVLQAIREGSTVHIRAEAPANGLSAPLRVQLVRYRPQETVTIEHGENAGRTVSYSNIVTNWEILDEWQGTSPLSISVGANGPDRTVVILQQQGPATIIAAARAD